MVMAMSLFVGGENFDELRKRDCYYVDKTEMLYELVKIQITLSRFLPVPAGLEKRSPCG
jgi:hypothetical protein